MDKDNTKSNILKSAEELFASNGFHETSTSMIAKHAGVNSALIFYYFNSKENLLKSLVQEKISQYRNARNTRFEAIGRIMREKTVTTELIDRMLSDGLDFFAENENLFRILIVDEFKKTGSDLGAFDIFETVLKDIIKMDEEKPALVGDSLLFFVKTLFFIFVPAVSYICLRDKMAKHTGTSVQALNVKFLSAYKDAYIRMFALELGIHVESSCQEVESDEGI